jgi:hypothetical protein
MTTTTLRAEITAEPYHSTSTTSRNEVTLEPYHLTSIILKANGTPEAYHSTSPTLRNEIEPETYHSTSTTLRAEIQPEPYLSKSTALRNEVTPEPYHSISTTLGNEAEPVPYHTISITLRAEITLEPYQSTSTTLKNEFEPEPYHSISTILTNEIKPEPYHSTSSTLNNQGAPTAYRRDITDGYGKAESEKQSHISYTSAAPACAAKTSHAAVPAVTSSAPLFGQVADHNNSDYPLVFAKQSPSSFVWSAVSYSTPAVKPVVPVMTTSTHSSLASTTPFRDNAVPTDAKIFVNTFRTANATAESAQDVKKNIASPPESTVKLEKVSTATASLTVTAPVSMLFQPLYPTTSGVANATSGIASATTCAINRYNSTLPEFEGATVPSSSLIAGSIVALAIAAFAV